MTEPRKLARRRRVVTKTQAKAIPRFLSSSRVITSSVSQLLYSFRWWIVERWPGGKENNVMLEFFDKPESEERRSRKSCCLQLWTSVYGAGWEYLPSTSIRCLGRGPKKCEHLWCFFPFLSHFRPFWPFLRPQKTLVLSSLGHPWGKTFLKQALTFRKWSLPESGGGSPVVLALCHHIIVLKMHISYQKVIVFVCFFGDSLSSFKF